MRRLGRSSLTPMVRRSITTSSAGHGAGLTRAAGRRYATGRSARQHGADRGQRDQRGVAAQRVGGLGGRGAEAWAGGQRSVPVEPQQIRGRGDEESLGGQRSDG